jgi:hypothetical protein
VLFGLLSKFGFGIIGYMDVSVMSKSLPNSVLPYPKGMWNRTKYYFWKGIYPLHNHIRNMLLATHILSHTGRQVYVFGNLAPGKSVEGFLEHLERHQFGNHFIAWDDDGQVISLRRLDGFEKQYHVRIFKDGEIRGHYEFTPECYPIMHYKSTGQEEKRDDFLSFFGDWIIPASAESTIRED